MLHGRQRDWGKDFYTEKLLENRASWDIYAGVRDIGCERSAANKSHVCRSMGNCHAKSGTFFRVIDMGPTFFAMHSIGLIDHSRVHGVVTIRVSSPIVPSRATRGVLISSLPMVAFSLVMIPSSNHVM